MVTPVQYIGTSKPFFETAITGGQQSWYPNQVRDRTDSDAALLIASGQFSKALVQVVDPNQDAVDGSALSPQIAALVSGAWNTALPFSTAITFASGGIMPDQNVTGAIAFTLALSGNAVNFSQVAVDLIANGTNAPTFAASMREADSSSGYYNVNGVRNLITFWLRSGIVYYSINQQKSFAPEPGISGAQILRLTNVTVWNETGNGATGWNYNTGNSGLFSASGNTDKKFAASTDGEFYFTAASVTGNYALAGIDVTASSAYNAGAAAYLLWIADDGRILRGNAGAYTQITGYTAVSGDAFCLARVGSTLQICLIRAGVRTVLYTWTGVPIIALNIGVFGGGTTALIQNLRGTGLA